MWISITYRGLHQTLIRIILVNWIMKFLLFKYIYNLCHYSPQLIYLQGYISTIKKKYNKYEISRHRLFRKGLFLSVKKFKSITSVPLWMWGTLVCFAGFYHNSVFINSYCWYSNVVLFTSRLVDDKQKICRSSGWITVHKRGTTLWKYKYDKRNDVKVSST